MAAACTIHFQPQLLRTVGSDYGCQIAGIALTWYLLGSEIHVESLMVVTSLFTDMVGNTPFQHTIDI